MVRSGAIVSFSTQETHKIQKIVLGIMSSDEIVCRNPL